ncbi:type VI secretion system baseplate subunit TssG [Gynuella sp.]|uniref:type VI secretion system baseplate subunit TssG n=1 Tax=Gynuella sp. TaxID=2969146 RepID=UPI003D0B9EB7
METKYWQKTDHIARITEQATEYHFHQLIETLLDICDGVEARNCPSWLKLKPSDWLSFPASDVRKVSVLPSEKIEVESTFFGFYGVDAPLPQYFLQDITYQDEDGKRLQAFLDIFNQQAYWLLHQGWRKFHLLQHAGENNLFVRLATSLAGVYFERHKLSGWAAGSLANRCRSAVGIEAVLRDTLQLPDLAVDDQIISNIEIEQTLSLNGQQALGEETVLGDHVAVLGHAIQIQTGMVTKEKAALLRPDGELGKRTREVLEYYLPQGVTYEVVIVLAPNQNTPFRLGEEELCFGQPILLGEDGAHPYRMVFSDHHYKHPEYRYSDQRYAA